MAVRFKSGPLFFLNSKGNEGSGRDWMDGSGIVVFVGMSRGTKVGYTMLGCAQKFQNIVVTLTNYELIIHKESKSKCIKTYS